MEFYIRLYHLYRTARFRTVRLFVFSFLLIIILYQMSQGITPKIPLFLFNIFVIVETFFHYKVARISPTVTLEKNNGKKMAESFTREALYWFVVEPTAQGVVKKIMQYPQIKTIMRKADISHKDLIFPDIGKDVLMQSAFDTAKTFNGTFVTSIDVFVAYLFLTEKESKLLFAKQLKTSDVYNILYWTKQEFPDEENPKKLRVHFEGGGIGEELVSGWTPETKKYTANFTSFAIRNEPVIQGREKEFKSILEGLLKVENNNVLLVGDIGAGKENLIKALAYHSFEGNLGGYLNFKRVFQLLVGALTAGVSARGDLETRLQEIIAEISHSSDVILYIPEFQNILGATSYNLDLSGAILPYMQEGTMPIIATVTSGNYKTYVERNPIKEAFTIVQLKEPDTNTTIEMVLSEAGKIEKKYKVILSYRSISSSVELADRFFQDQVLPGSAVALLETVANAVSLSQTEPYFEKTHQKMVREEHVIRKVEETTHVAIAAPTKEEINVLLHLEDKLHGRVIEQNEAVTAIAEAMRRVRSGVMNSQKPISFLFLGPTGVGKTETAKALADFYFGGEKNMIRLDMSEYTDENGIRRLLGAPPGQGQERGELTDKIHDNPASLVLLDEFEKANPAIHNLFLQVLDDGRLTDNKGVTVSFRNCIIIATSNAGSEFIREEVAKGTPLNKQFQHRLMEYLQSKNIFKPELVNRFDDVITFKPLGGNQVGQVVRLILEQLKKHLADQDIALVYDDAVVEKITQEGFDQEFGARPLRRFVQDNIEDMIAQKKLTQELVRGKTASFSVDGTGALKLDVS